MDTRTLPFVITGCAVGFVSGLLGIGGAILLVPILVLGFGFSQAAAQGTSIGALVPPIGIFAAVHYYRSGFLDVRAAALIAAGFLFGALGGAAVVPYVPQVWIRRAFATMLVYVAVQMAFADPSRKMGAVLPGFAAALALWVVYWARRLFGQKPQKPAPPKPPRIEYYI